MHEVPIPIIIKFVLHARVQDSETLRQAFCFVSFFPHCYLLTTSSTVIFKSVADRFYIALFSALEQIHCVRI